jgi:outer membrane protein OmpA-like peptidoglycan-associated protein
MSNMKKTVLSISLCAIVLASCQSTDPLTGRTQINNTAGGAVLGALAGAGAGLLVANNKSGDDKRKAALIGAGIGLLVGGSVGNYMDKQEQELRQQLVNSGVSVTRVGGNIVLNLPSNVTFASDSSNINQAFGGVLNSVAIILNKYPKTLLDIDGHTDATGSAQHNQQLSEKRATSVGRYLNGQLVDPRRLLIAGFGETRPIATNATADGRATNRRVEIRIAPLGQDV